MGKGWRCQMEVELKNRLIKLLGEIEHVFDYELKERFCPVCECGSSDGHESDCEFKTVFDLLKIN
jgi:hypothetical protein